MICPHWQGCLHKRTVADSWQYAFLFCLRANSLFSYLHSISICAFLCILLYLFLSSANICKWVVLVTYEDSITSIFTKLVLHMKQYYKISYKFIHCEVLKNKDGPATQRTALLFQICGWMSDISGSKVEEVDRLGWRVTLMMQMLICCNKYF